MIKLNRFHPLREFHTSILRSDLETLKPQSIKLQLIKTNVNAKLWLNMLIFKSLSKMRKRLNRLFNAQLKSKNSAIKRDIYEK